MDIMLSAAPRIVEIQVNDDSIIAQLADGRSISVPLVWSWRLSHATSEQRSNFEIIDNGLGVHWADIDEDVSATGMLYGIPARPQKATAQRKRRQQPPLRPTVAPF